MYTVGTSEPLPEVRGLPSRTVRFVDVPRRRCFMIDGAGMPDDSPEASARFQAAIQALFGVAYTLHFILKRRDVTSPVGSLEALWSWTSCGPGEPPLDGTLASAAWTAVLPIPAEATDADIDLAIADLRKKKDPEALGLLRIAALEEGPCAEVMHIGPYDAEEPTISSLHDAIKAGGRHPTGRHHEIYISDPRRVPPERLRTVIRQPVR